ncbi:hypothetical protein HY634_01590 [Candidatus Uhrbacteria bacterium]|nr:hypothetical protein [Candidatus Uhrbacteria bacterium]
MRRFEAPIAIILSLAAASVLTMGVIVPTFRIVVSFHRATVAEHEQLEHRYRRSIERGRAVQEFSQMEQELAMLRGRVPLERDALTFVRALEAIASRHLLEERIAIDWNAVTRDDRRLMRIPTTMELTGTYPNLIAALRDIERMPLPPAFDRLSFTTSASNGFTPSASRGRVQLVVRAETLWVSAP